MNNLLFKDEVYAIVGAAMEVHRTLGCGFLEAVYQEALELELTNRGIPFLPQKELPIQYKGTTSKKVYVADLVVYDKVIAELKANNRLTTIDEAQIINYLKATGMRVGVLINFSKESLERKRKIFGPNQPKISEIREISG
jgi:GxxExxY protein